MYKTISLLLLCALLLAFVPVNAQPCYGPAFDGHPMLQAECLHQLKVSPKDTKDTPCYLRGWECQHPEPLH